MKLKSMVVVGLPFLLLPQLASAQILSVKGASANFREKPSESAKVKYSADRFYPVEVMEKKAGWVKVKDFEGDEAWVAERLLTSQPSIVITADKANIRESPNTTSDVLFKVERGEVFKIESRKEHWLKVVDSKGDGGWIRDDMTWGEENEGKADKLEKIEKSSGKPESQSKAKEQKEEKPKPEAKEKEGILESTTKEAMKLGTAIASQENLESLCRAYLDEEVKLEKPTKAEKQEKAEKPSKPVAEKKKAQGKPAQKPKPAQKKK